MRVLQKIFALLFLCIVFLSPDKGLAQTLSGTIIDASDFGGIASVAIRNKQTSQIVFSDSKGNYSINAKQGDTILFFSQGYHSSQFVMPQSHSLQHQIVLQRKPVTIQDISIRPGYTPYQLDSIDRRSSYEGALGQKKTTSAMSPFSLLADNISRKAKQRWNFQKNFALWEKQKFKDTRYSPDEVSALTGLSGDSLAAFMNAYPIPYDYARAASDLEIKLWIKNNFRQWIRHPFVPDLPDVTIPKKK